jgi:flagellin
MAFSVNTNAGALIALQNLNKTSSQLERTQNTINTGLKVANAKDNSAIFAIAQKMRADVSGLNAVKQSLDRAQSTLDVGLAAGEAVSDLLVEMKEKAVAAADSGLDTASRTALNDEFTQLRAQISTIIGNAEFNGINMVGGITPSNVVAIVNDDATNTITVAAQNMNFGQTVKIASTEAINTQALAASAVTGIESSITAVNSALFKMGVGSRRIGLQREFVNKLSDAINVGIGNLVDADLAEESAKLQALQVKQQLGLQALSIANQAPATTLGLFR